MSPGDLVVAVEDNKVRYLLMRQLDRLSIKYNICQLGDAICEVASVIISDVVDPLTISSRIIIVRDADDIEGAIIAALVKLNGISQPLIATLGVDPGLRFGLALVVEGILIRSESASSPADAADIAVRWASIINHRFDECMLTIRVGSGSRLFSTLFLRALRRRSRAFSIELIDEHHTTLTSGADNDQSSAALIALRSGPAVGEVLPALDEKTGYIRLLKRLFARLTSGGALSTKDACRILSGDLTLDGVVDDYSPKND